MKRLFNVVSLCILLVAGAVSVGCQGGEETIGGPGGQDIPQSFAYAGNPYMSTGDKVAEQHLDDDTPSNVLYIGSGSQQGGEYDVYLIQGVDEDDAIALKICPGGGYWYMEYERVHGQGEPESFSYQGRHYTNTGEILDIVVLGSDNDTPEALSHLDSVVYQGTTYDVFSIQDADPNLTVALRIAKAGKKAGFCYYYFRYQSTSASVHLGEEFVLHEGERVTIEGEDLAVRVLEFIYAPCPEGMQCFWSGLAVGLEFCHAGQVETKLAQQGFTQVFGYQVTILDTDYKTFARLSVSKV